MLIMIMTIMTLKKFCLRWMILGDKLTVNGYILYGTDCNSCITLTLDHFSNEMAVYVSYYLHSSRIIAADQE